MVRGSRSISRPTTRVFFEHVAFGLGVRRARRQGCPRSELPVIARHRHQHNGVFYFVFATRLLPTVADFGRICTVNIFAVLVVSVGSLGLPTAATRFIAKYVASEQEGQAHIVYQRVLRLGIGLSALSLLSVVLGSKLLSQLFLGSPDFSFLFQLAGL